MPLTVSACRSLCDWARTPASYEGLPLLACRGCGSQWVRSEPWTPAQADGSRPAAVREELAVREQDAGGPVSRAGAAGSADS